MHAKQKTGAAIVAMLFIAGLVFGWLRYHERKSPRELLIYGNVEIRQVSLAFNASERIAQLLVQEGNRVAAGQVLARLDTRTLALRAQQARAQIGVQEQVLARLKNGSRPEEVQEARAKVRAAQADAELAAQTRARLETTFKATDGQGVARTELDAANARLHSALAQLEAARKAAALIAKGPRKEDIAQADAQLAFARTELALMERQLTEAELRSPVDAVVRARLLEPGDMASPQKPVFTLAIMHPKWIRAYVTEADLHRVRPGQNVAVQVDGLNSAVPGTIGYISSVAEFTPKTVQTEQLRTSLVYEVRVNIDDPEDVLRLGQPVTVRLNADRNP